MPGFWILEYQLLLQKLHSYGKVSNLGGPIKAGGTNILLVRLAYSYSIVLIVIIVFVLKVLINLYVRSEY